MLFVFDDQHHIYSNCTQLLKTKLAAKSNFYYVTMFTLMSLLRCPYSHRNWRIWKRSQKSVHLVPSFGLPHLSVDLSAIETQLTPAQQPPQWWQRQERIELIPVRWRPDSCDLSSRNPVRNLSTDLKQLLKHHPAWVALVRFEVWQRNEVETLRSVMLPASQSSVEQLQTHVGCLARLI